MKCIIDFETKSDIPISEGAVKYLNHPSADIICMGYKIGNYKTKLWIPGQKVPYIVKSIYAHNALFDYRVWHILGKKYDFPKRPLDQWIDTMALCARYTYPHSLDKAGEALQLKIKKNPRGKYLIKKICCPPYEYTDEELYEFYEYCKTDVDTTDLLIKALPASRLSENEQDIWVLTQYMNMQGIPIDTKTAKLILGLTQAYQVEQVQRLPELTNQKVHTIGQIKKIVQWVNKQGVPITNLQAPTVEKLLKQELPNNVKEVLEMRQELGSTSVKKYKTLVNNTYQGFLYDLFKYYGAGKTGRWASLGFQMHNLPRAKVKDPEAEIKKFYDLAILEEDPILSAKALIRPMIMAPNGYYFVVMDYSAIEYVLLSWVTQDWYFVDLYGNNKDQYKDMASFLFTKPIDEITDDERFRGKVIILGCGYGLGAVGFKAQAESWGLKLTDRECSNAVDAYRERYSKVKTFWYTCKDLAIAAISNPGQAYEVYNCIFRVVLDRNKNKWLQLTLPSGRALYYNSPAIKSGKYGAEVAHMGINPYTHKWSSLRIIPGRFVENIIQALARDLLAHSKQILFENKIRVIGSVHDEIITLVKEENKYLALKKVEQLMCITPDWCRYMPLKAKGYTAKRYKKD